MSLQVPQMRPHLLAWRPIIPHNIYMPSLKRGIQYASTKYQGVGKKIRAFGGTVKKAIGDFRPGKATGYYKTLTVREAVKSLPKNIKTIRDAFKKRK